MPCCLLGLLVTACCSNAAGPYSGQVGQPLKSLERFVQDLSSRYGIHFLQSVIRPSMTISSIELPNGFMDPHLGFSRTSSVAKGQLREDRHVLKTTADHAAGLGTGRPTPSIDPGHSRPCGAFTELLRSFY